jgi:hypothetical protein
MPESFAAHRQDQQWTDRIDELGMLYWKTGVLVIGLRVVIVVSLPPLRLATFAQLATLLLWSALALVIADLLRLAWRALRAIYAGHGGQPAARLGELWRAWLAGNWQIQLAIDCVLAAAIMLIAIGLAVQERLDWRYVGWIAIMGLIRVAFKERSRRPSARVGQ